MGKYSFHTSIDSKPLFIYNIPIRYPSSVIDFHFQKCLRQHLTPSSSYLFYPDTERKLYQIRNAIIDQLTPRQTQVAKRVAAWNMEDKNTNINDIPQNQLELSKTDTDIKRKHKKPNYQDHLFVHYTHERRFLSMKRDIQHVYQNVFGQTPAMHLRLYVGNRNRPNATKELIRKRPKTRILKHKQNHAKYQQT